MKTIVIALATFALLGCADEKVDTNFLCKECPEPIICETVEPLPCEPVACEETIYGNLTNEWMERIDTSSIKLNHYINEVEVEENLADVIDVDGNGTLGTSNPITVPEYVGEPMKHTLIIEFWQTN